MSVFELKKAINIKTVFLFILINAVSCTFFFLAHKGIKMSVSTRIEEEIYAQIGGELTKKKEDEIEALMEQNAEIIGSENDYENRYLKGEINIDEYMKYRDRYHFEFNRKEALESVYERYTVIRDTGNRLIFDAYYKLLFNPKRNMWGLILSFYLLAVLLSYCEPRELSPVLNVTAKGKSGIWRDKVRTAAFFSMLLVMVYAVTEHIVSAAFYPIKYLEAPVQSISCLSEVSLPISIGAWYALTLTVRLVVSALFTGILCSILYFAKDKKSTLVILLLLYAVPLLISKLTGNDTFNVITKLITVYPVL